MAQDFKTIASQAVASLQQAEKQIADLKSQLAMTKQASAVDNKLVDQTVAAMIKCGSITQEQKAQVTELLTNNKQASLRALKAVCDATSADAQRIVKTASQELSYGTLVSLDKKASKAAKVQDGLNAYAVAAKALKLELK